MADRRIDQLTEAEDISDEDLFVIWKENISQTRSIKKGTMNLATKSYVDSRLPDWNNAVQITASQLTTGYTAPADGIIVGATYANVLTTSYATINDVIVGRTETGKAYSSYINVQCPVSHGDVFKITNVNTIDTNMSFVPYKTLS